MNVVHLAVPTKVSGYPGFPALYKMLGLVVSLE
jgi:hypothetical protein